MSPLLPALIASLLAGGVGPAPGVTLKDEGTSQGRVTALNCVGSTVTCSRSGTTGTVSVSAGGGAGNYASATLTFTNGGYTSVAVTGQAWVGATSTITCSLQHSASVSGSNNTPEVYAVAAISLTVSTLSAGVGFTVNAYTPNGATGSFNVTCSGV